MNTRQFSCAVLLLLSLRLVSQAQTAPAHEQTGMHNSAMAPSDHMERRFNEADEWAKTFDDPARDKWQMPERVIATLQLKPGQIVADIGAGTGYFSVRLAKSKAAPRVYAVDVEASMVDYLRKRTAKEGLKNLVAVQASADAANLPEAVDLILIVDTYHHIGNRVAYFRGLSKSLKPNGRLAIVDWTEAAIAGGPPKEFRFSPDRLKAELTQAGFTPVAQHDFLPEQEFLIFEASDSGAR